MNSTPQIHKSTATPLQKIVYLLETKDCIPRELPGGGYQSLCPAHDDNKPSLSINEGTDERVLLHCHAGCEPSAGGGPGMVSSRSQTTASPR